VYRQCQRGYWRASKRWCKALPPEGVNKALLRFANNEAGLRPADVYGGARGAIAQLKELEAWFQARARCPPVLAQGSWRPGSWLKKLEAWFQGRARGLPVLAQGAGGLGPGARARAALPVLARALACSGAGACAGGQRLRATRPAAQGARGGLRALGAHSRRPQGVGRSPRGCRQLGRQGRLPRVDSGR
jgi:hypothetical protein